MRKTFFYNFLPTKAEEESAAARNNQHQLTRAIVEIRDWYGQPRINLTNPWQIKRTITRNEVSTEEIVLSHEEMFEHVFRYWNVEFANQVVQGNKCVVILIDYIEENMPKIYQSVYVKMNNESNVVGLTELIRSRGVNIGDEIGFFWDMRAATYGFAFKLLLRGN